MPESARRWDPVCRPVVRPIRVLLFLVFLALLSVLLSRPILTSYARWLVDTDPARRADVAIVLAGGEGERLLAGMRIFREGRVGALLIVGPDTPLLPVYSGEDSLTQGEVKRRIAVRKGIPADRVWLALGATSTYEEALAARKFLEGEAVKDLIVVTSPLHSRRARATFRHVFRDSGIDVTLETLPPDLSTEHVERWWTRERETMSLFSETVKILYYWNRHGIRPWGAG